MHDLSKFPKTGNDFSNDGYYFVFGDRSLAGGVAFQILICNFHHDEILIRIGVLATVKNRDNVSQGFSDKFFSDSEFAMSGFSGGKMQPLYRDTTARFVSPQKNGAESSGYP
jgi:hypothetical protein